MMQRFKIVNASGKVLRDFKTPDKPEVWARFLKYNEHLLLLDGRMYGRLSVLGKQYYRGKKKGIPQYATNY